MEVSGARRRWALVCRALSVLAVGMDLTVLSVALPTLAVALKASESDLQGSPPATLWCWLPRCCPPDCWATATAARR